MNAQVATILIKYPKRNIMKCFFKARLFAFSPLKKIFFEICPCAVISVISFGRILSSWKPLSVHATHCAPTGGPRFLQTDRIQQFQNKTSQTSLTQSFHACHKGTPLWKSLHFSREGYIFWFSPCSISCARFPIGGARFPVGTARFPIGNARFPVGNRISCNPVEILGIR